MAKRGTRYVYDSGEIYRLTEKQYRDYIFKNVTKAYTEGAHMFGVLVGTASFNATRATKVDFEDEARRLRADDKVRSTEAKGSSSWTNR